MGGSRSGRVVATSGPVARSVDPREDGSVIRPVDRWPLGVWLRAAAAIGLFVGLAPAALAAPPNSAPPLTSRSAPDAAALPAWTGGINLYRSGVFTTQASWLYCTAADVQIARNMARGTEDHRASAQTTYFDWMRTKNRYDLPLSAGVDPAGWTAGMRHFVDDRYRLVSTHSFGYSLQLAVQRMRLTNLPVALAVAHGDHGWILNGFTATADPAKTADFEITSVSVTGPLWGLQSKGGYDMKPNTKLTVDQLKTYFTRWHYDPLPMIWDGTFVSIQPVPAAAAPKPTAAPTATIAATPTPTPTVTVAPTPTPTEQPTPTSTLAPAQATESPSPSASTAPASQPGSSSGSSSLLIVAVAVLVAAGLAVGLIVRARRTF
jgi:hypothetical protein